MKTITVSWGPAPGDGKRTMYYVDGSPVGEDNVGFDKVLDAVRAHSNMRVTLKIPDTPSLGGQRLTDSFPFSERFNELQEALGDDKLIFEFS